MNIIEKINRKALRIRNGNDKIKPGQVVRLSEAAAVNDAVRQGDLYLVVVDKFPVKHLLSDKPSTKLVPGRTAGSRHCLDSLDGVTLYVPPAWNDMYSGLIGPCFSTTIERTVTHPTHGDVVIPARFTILCVYQREWDSELKLARRNAD